jgi:hypothetical protein
VLREGDMKKPTYSAKCAKHVFSEQLAFDEVCENEFDVYEVMES